MNRQPIGIFDSGIGGLTVARAIVDHLPSESLLYFGDTARVPYGTQSAATIRQYSEAISRYLVGQGCKVIVVACNTASAAALTHLRKLWPAIPFIGMEPAVKPGAQATQTGVVGVLATEGTFSSSRYAQLMERYASTVTVIEDPCLGLVEHIEKGDLDTPATQALLQTILEPMLTKGADTIVLGCTHYPFVEPLIRQIAGPAVSIINPAPAVARQLQHVLEQHNLQRVSALPPSYQFQVSGPGGQFEELATLMMGFPVRVSFHTEV
jgi:glutamate racemase